MELTTGMIVLIGWSVVFIIAIALLIIFVFRIYGQFGQLQKTVTEIDRKTDASMTGVSMEGDPMRDNYMISYNGDQFEGGNLIGAVRTESMSFDGGNSEAPKERPKQMVPVKPIDVIKELQVTPTNWSLNGVEEKIKIMTAKKDLLSNSRSGRDLDAVLFCLNNRLKCLDEYEYEEGKTMTFKAFFEQWDATTEANINALIEKYNNLAFHSADIFVPEFPDVAAKIMIAYNDAVVDLAEKKPRFYIIADKKDFKKRYESRDPILLVQSPFGFYYHILGAWDKEMQYLPEL